MHPAIKSDKSLILRDFQRRYGFANKDMAHICGCSLPTIQKWRSGEVKVSGAAAKLLSLLDYTSNGDPELCTKLVDDLDKSSELETMLRMVSATDEAKVKQAYSPSDDQLELMLANRRKEKELQELEERYQSVLESFGGPACRWMPDTTLTYVNPQYRELYEKDGESILGKKWIEFLPEAERAETMTIVWDMVRRGEGRTMANEGVGRSGEVSFQVWKDIPIKNDQGEVVEFHSVGIDKTSEISFEQGLRNYSSLVRALINFVGKGIIVFDIDGEIREKSAEAINEVSELKSAQTLGELISKEKFQKFKRLLKNLKRSEQMSFYIEYNGCLLTMLIEHYDDYLDKKQFIATIDCSGKLSHSPLMDQRLKSEGFVPKRGRGDEETTLEKVEAGFKWIGETTGVCRIYAFRLKEGQAVMDNFVEWCATGVAPQIEELRDVSTDEYVWWMSKLNRGGNICVEDVTKLPRTAENERSILLAQGIHAVIVSPIVKEGALVGFVGFDHLGSARKWHEQEEMALDSLVNLLLPLF